MNRTIYIKVTTKEQLDAVISWGQADGLLAEYELLGGVPTRPMCPVHYCLPDVAREYRIKSIEQMIAEVERETAGVVIRNLDELGLLAEKGFEGPVIADAFLYAYNQEAAAFYLEDLPQLKFILSDELTDREALELTMAREIGTDRFLYKVYGHQQLMITNQCILKNYSNCKKKQMTFTDEKGNSFLAVGRCNQCYSVIYNGAATWMLDKLEEISYENLLVDFTVESAGEVRDILKVLERAMTDPKTAGKPAGITRGHHYKGID